MRKLDQKEVQKIAKRWPIEPLQIAVYVMSGGGFLGRHAAEHPQSFYIDDRVGRLPYLKREICQAVATLVTLAEANGLDPENLPEMLHFHNCGIF